MKKCVVIYNRKSGIRKKDYSNILKETLISYRYDPVIIYTEYKGHAIEIASLVNQVDLLIAVGGDGTYNEVMTGNLKRDKTLLVGHIPVGTTNDMGKMYGYTNNFKHNLELLMDGVKKRIDVCTINDRPALYTACFGKFTDIPYITPRQKKERIGNMAYALEALKDSVYRPKLYELTYRVNDEIHTGKYSLVIVSSSNRIAGIDKFYKDVKLNDNQFEILFCKFKTQRELVRSFMALKIGDLDHASGFEFHKSDNLEIIFKNELDKSWCIDGEEYKTTSTTFNIKNSRSVEVLMPKVNIDKLFIK